MKGLLQAGIGATAQAVRDGKVSAVEVARFALSAIEKIDGKLGAFLCVDHEGALSSAAQVDAKRQRGEALGALAGVPIAVKDNICTRGVATTCASKILEGYIPPYDAHVVSQLRKEDALILGKTNLDEFAMGSSTENSAYKKVHNPWDLARVPGGSSGGSAAAVAAGFVAGALGTDTGGSVRQPGAFCGISALKPTYGRVSRYGVVAFASSLDQVGPMARSVRDTATLAQVLAGHDERDATSAKRAVDNFSDGCEQKVKGLRIGVVRDQLEQVEDAEVRKATEKVLATLKKDGAELVDLKLPHAKHAVSVYYLIAPAEASSNLARFDGMRYGLRVAAPNLLQTYGKTRAQGFGAEVRRRIMLGTYALSAGYYDAYYLKAQKVRALIQQDYARAFEACDLILSPTTPTPAFKLGDKSSDPLAMYLADIFTLPPSLAGLPALAVPCALSATKLPIGVQLTGRAFEETTLFRCAQSIEDHAALLTTWPSTSVGAAS